MAFGPGDGSAFRVCAAAILGAGTAMIRCQPMSPWVRGGGGRGATDDGAAGIDGAGLGMRHQLDRQRQHARAGGFGEVAQRLEMDLTDFAHSRIRNGLTGHRAVHQGGDFRSA